MLYLQTRIHLQKVKGPGLINNKFHRPGPDITTGLRRLNCCIPHGLSHGLANKGRRRLLHHLLVPALNRTVPFPEMNRIPLLIRKHLDLNMPRPNNRLLKDQLTIPESRLRLRPRPRQLIRQRRRFMHQPHPTPAAPGRRLDHHRIPNLLRSFLPGPRIRLRTLKPRHRRHPRLGHRLLRPPLTPHQLHGLSRRPDKGNPMIRTG